MTGSGFAETHAIFQSMETESFIGQVRRFGPHGPAYEVLTARARDVDIIVIESGERLTYGLMEFLADPIAETVP